MGGREAAEETEPLPSLARRQRDAGKRTKQEEGLGAFFMCFKNLGRGKLFFNQQAVLILFMNVGQVNSCCSCIEILRLTIEK